MRGNGPGLAAVSHHHPNLPLAIFGTVLIVVMLAAPGGIASLGSKAKKAGSKAKKPFHRIHRRKGA